MKTKFFWIIFLAFPCLILWSSLLSPETANAQGGTVAWEDPIPLSDSSVQAWHPTIAADLAGNVHIMWSQSTSMERPVGYGDTLYYTRWDGKKWIAPVDVLVSPEAGLGAEFPDITITPDGTLHAIWGTGGINSRLYYSRAPACCAEDPRNWSKPFMIGIGVNETSALIHDSRGRLYVMYASLDTKEPIFLRSDDGGNTWSKPVRLVSGIRQSNEYTAYTRLAVDGRGVLHAVWTVMPFPGKRVVYAQSSDQGMTWTDPTSIDEYSPEKYLEGFGPFLIDVEAVGEQEIHLTWDGAPTVERHHVWSRDGGKTWSEPDTFIPELTGGGRALWNDMVADSQNTLHAVSIKQPWHAQWLGNGWTPSTPIGQRGFAENMRITVSEGYILHVVWLEVVEGIPSVVYYNRGITQAPPLPQQTLPPSPLLDTETQFASPSLSPTDTFMPTIVNPIPSKNAGTNPALGAFISLGVVSLFLVGIVFWITRKHSR